MSNESHLSNALSPKLGNESYWRKPYPQTRQSPLCAGTSPPCASDANVCRSISPLGKSGGVVQVSKKLKLKKKEVDDVLGGEDAWKNVERTSGEF
jgi:hypothetical protein